jgi:nucleotide-binding universal stress UspA family protein
MRAILAILWSEQTAPMVLDLATRTARIFGSHVTGLAVRPTFESFIPSGDFGLALSQDYIDRIQQESASRVSRLREMFLAHAGREGLDHGWVEGEGSSASTIASVGRLYDVAVLARPDLGGSAEPEIMLEAALFETGRPILVAPPVMPQAFGRSIMIAWNGSSETARTIADSLPFLKKAEEVHIVSVDSGMVPGPGGGDVARYLERHDIRATNAHAVAGDRNPGAAMLDEARRLGCDLMIKGAYTQSRLKQMIFGGATQHILNNADIPVFFAH